MCLIRRWLAALAILGAVVTLAAGCGPQHVAEPRASSPGAASPSAAPAPTPTTVTQFDPQWMGLVPDQPRGWKELNRRITGEFQQFSLRPADETEMRMGCNGCAPWTVDLTAYAPGKFDPTEAQTGQLVNVNGEGDGFLTEDPAKHTATLTWPYADSAWATVKGLTPATTQLDRMVELAHALKPVERTPIRLPMSMPEVPANMPLAEINVDGTGDYGTVIEFAPCGRPTNGGAGDCGRQPDVETMSVHIWPSDRVDWYFNDEGAVPLKIGGKDGFFDDALTGAGDHAAVQVQPGMLVVFDSGVGDVYRTGDPPQPPTRLKTILATLEWAPDPANEASWTPVSDWAK
ncbi:hypothetical protein CIW52_22355 [Mycolicibacterium sp. P9-64]|uniref:hypothetical protein n=1 Tax=Mycolicibacterium sp. P9-64 TaxID=2024612 RepID=UPI0011EBB5CD|nr:hypothetical protein [Mycolicibacterium sp. P9-64]KAA0081345.1 hypothetical protein CIW52_22355 [Mycolicibacterium sp. P9-64]